MEAESYDVDVAIVGAGFSGSMLAVHLAKEPSTRTALFERDEFARGLAYSTKNPRHLLNLTPDKMSPFPEKPAAFFEWLEIQEPVTFVPRARYARYLQSIFDGAMRGATHVTLYNDAVVSIVPEAGGFRVRTERDSVSARCVVLAVGNFPPGEDFVPVALRDDPRVVRNPWAVPFDELSGDVLVAGNGLTALDVLVELGHRNYGGKITMFSRHGRAPQTHKTYGSPVEVTLDKGTPLRLLRSMRRAVAVVEREGGDWRAVVDGIRLQVQSIWQSWPLNEQLRFLRHLRPYWETTRRRIPPEVAAAVSALESNGRLERIAGRIQSIEKQPDGRFRTVLAHAGHTTTLNVDWILNCTGPQANIEKIDDPLIRALREARLISPHPTRLGIQASADGRVFDARGVPQDNLFAVGSLMRGVLYESISVMELREQVKALAPKLVPSVTPLRT